MLEFIKQFGVTLDYTIDDYYDRQYSDNKYLGMFNEKRQFIPSLILLTEIAALTTQFIVVNEKSAWLFVCGKNVLPEGIVSKGEFKIGNPVLVLDESKRVLGYGMYKEKEISNRFNIGDFLKRES